MTDDHQKRITEHRVELLQRMDPAGVLNYLRGKEVLTSIKTDDIRHAGGNYKQNELLLDCIHQKPDYDFSELHNALYETGQKHSSELLEPNQHNKHPHNRSTMGGHLHSRWPIWPFFMAIVILLIAIVVCIWNMYSCPTQVASYPVPLLGLPYVLVIAEEKKCRKQSVRKHYLFS